MKLLTHRTLAIVFAAALAAATISCQSAQKQTFIPPPQAQAPALPAASKAPEQPSQAQAKNVKPAPEPQPKAALAAQPMRSDAVADLIAKVEKEYQAGEANHQAGHLDAAKQNFDTAANLLLNSGFDLRSDERLEKELERVLEGSNSLESVAQQQSDSSDQQKSEPAPIDEANEATPAVDANVKAKAEAEIKSTRSDLPLMMTDQVAGYINFYSTRGRGMLERALARSGRYDEMIRRVLKEEGVPQDLIYLAQAESGFHPLAVSRVGARGMWQFMGSRAKGYGLQRNFWVDERQDPEKSTRAAARHLKDLYAQFGDWYLAMAAYNSGPGRVQSAVKRTGYADFWELYRRNVLPKETRNYVPIIVAVTIMAKNPEQYGLDDVNLDKPIPFDTVKINYPIDLRLVAECVDATATDLQDLNPSLLRLTTPKDREFELRLPAGSKEKFVSAVAAIPADKRLWWRYHKVQNGETLASLAKTYHTTATAISQANKLEEASLEPESRLVIPIAPGKYSDTGTYARRITRYRVHRGDTVETVAENFAVPARMVRGWNHLKGNSLAGRRVLYLHLPVTPGAPGYEVASKSKASKKAGKPTVKATTASVSAGVVQHKVRQGETLYSIASSYNTTVAALQRYNRNTAILRPGMILVVRDAH
jgi:membrane-bound lytic murein transglycosylase D